MACMLFFQTADNDCMCVSSEVVNTIENDGDGSVHVSFLNAGAAGGVLGAPGAIVGGIIGLLSGL